MNDGKLKPRAIKCIFLGFKTRVKGFRLRCVEAKSPQFIISRDVKFDEHAMLRNKKKELVVVGQDHRVRKQVELQVKNLKNHKKVLLISP